MEQPLVLVGHADSAVHALLKRMLATFGYRVHTVSGGEEAIDQVAQGEATVVLLDLDLVGMSGTDTLRAIRAMAQAPEVVVTSANGTVATAAEVARHGAFDFVAQP